MGEEVTKKELMVLRVTYLVLPYKTCEDVSLLIHHVLKNLETGPRKFSLALGNLGFNFLGMLSLSFDP